MASPGTFSFAAGPLATLFCAVLWFSALLELVSLAHGVACGIQPLQKQLGSRSLVIRPMCVDRPEHAFSFSFEQILAICLTQRAWQGETENYSRPK